MARTPEGLTAEQVATMRYDASHKERGQAKEVVIQRLCDEVDRLRTALAQRTEENERLAQAIREHRDARGDDRCWLDDETLYASLPEGFKPPERDASVELNLCRRYIESRHNPATVYVSPQREIESLTAALAQAREQRDAVLRDVAKLPSPVEFGYRFSQQGTRHNCHWCKAEWHGVVSVTPHPDNGCLWALATLAASGRGSAPQGDT